MEIHLQPTLESARARLVPLSPDDFDTLYAAASDPAVWAQHPNPERYKREVFQVFFDGAIASKGAFKIVEKATGLVAGSTRFYYHTDADPNLYIGYTFYATRYWGTGLNAEVKRLMLDYVFEYVDRVRFQIGAQNVRSQIAIGRIGVLKVGEETVAYHGEPPRHNFIYEIDKDGKWKIENGR